jgi:hypothetical protein
LDPSEPTTPEAPVIRLVDIDLKGTTMSTTPKTGLDIFCILAAGSILLCMSSSGWAQQKYAYKGAPGSTTKYVEQHAIDVGDVPGHQIRVARLQTKYGDEAPAFDGVKVVESFASLSSDYINGSGRFVVYSVLTMANGDKIYERGEAISQSSVAADGSKKTSFSEVFSLVGGTGKFSTIRGTLRQTGATDFKTGTSDNVTEGEYWFDK